MEEENNQIKMVTTAKKPRNTQTKRVPIPEPGHVEETLQQMQNKSEILSFDSIKEILSQSNGSGFYNIYVPSLNKELTFKQLTVGQQRSIAKNSADYNNIASNIKNRASILKTICVSSEDIDFLNITWPEFVYILAIVRANNFTDELKYKIQCSDTEKCNTSYEYSVNFDEIISNLEKVINKINDNKIFAFNMGDNKIEFIMNYPSVKKYNELLEFQEKILRLQKEGKEEEIESAMLDSFSYAFIKNIKFNGNLIDIKAETSLDLYRKIDETFNFNFASLLKFIDNEFSDFQMALSKKLHCPKCNSITEFDLGIDDFFEL